MFPASDCKHADCKFNVCSWTIATTDADVYHEIYDSFYLLYNQQNCRPSFFHHFQLLPRTAIAVKKRENVTFGDHLDRCVEWTEGTSSQDCWGRGWRGRLIDILSSPLSGIASNASQCHGGGEGEVTFIAFDNAQSLNRNEESVSSPFTTHVFSDICTMYSKRENIVLKNK